MSTEYSAVVNNESTIHASTIDELLQNASIIADRYNYRRDELEVTLPSGDVITMYRNNEMSAAGIIHGTWF